MDQQLYAITMMMKWTMPETFKDHSLPLLSTFTHTMFIYSMHWEIMGGGGLCDILVDSDVHAAATVD